MKCPKCGEWVEVFVQMGGAILQSQSPICGVNQVYDGTFSGKLIPGSGVFAQALKDAEDIAESEG